MKKLWDNKRYYSLNYYLKEQYHEKLYKLSLDGNMTCPNRDGHLDTRGCIFCSAGGSGDFAGTGNRTDSITTQIQFKKEQLRTKSSATSYIAYFQSYTNTYESVDYLKGIYLEALEDPSIKILSIATRPDCLDNDILDLLSELNKKKTIWIELGLQSVSEDTATYIRRGYTLEVFEQAVNKLRQRNISVVVHTILGLPSESKDGILDTIHYLNNLDIQGIKIQLLHVLQHTDLAKEYAKSHFWLPTLEEYLELLGNCISILRPDIVVHRLTGDGPKDILIAPLWTGNKRLVLNSIEKYFKDQDIWQGKQYIKP